MSGGGAHRLRCDRAHRHGAAAAEVWWRRADLVAAPWFRRWVHGRRHSRARPWSRGAARRPPLPATQASGRARSL